MPNPTEILIEKLKLRLLLRERVFIKWEDESGTPCTLGTRSSRNKQGLKFFIAAYHDMEGCIHIHFSLEVSITVGGNKQEIEMLLVVPPNADFANASKPRLISNINDLSRLDASAIHDAEISHSMHVLCIQFDLIAKGFIVIKKKTNMTIKPRNITSKILIRGLESLSNTKSFTVYIKPNDYALVGLEELRNRLSSTGASIDIHKPNIKEIYIEQTPELMEWCTTHDSVSLPPPYTENPRQLLSEVQVPRSPPAIFEKGTPLINTTEAVIAETPPQLVPEVQVGLPSPIIFEQEAPLIDTIQTVIAEKPARISSSPNSTSVHGIFSPSREESSDSEVNLNHMGEDSRCTLTNFDIDSDEEQLANLNSRELDHDPEISQMLNSKLLKWVQTVIRMNSNVHEHTRLTTKLSILGKCIRTSNASIFDATLLWCSALFFYDPLDSDPDSTLGLWEERNSWLISDIARLIQWANGMHHNVETNSSLWKHFIKLGDAARTVALNTRFNNYKYYDQKSVCIVCILAEFRDLGGGGGDGGISKESKSASRKGLGTASNASKRVKL
ncbi:uncharacterized protein EAE97_009958 [Botrytis byssoidea]|uniref:Uncharacterized protein n=1 Tax=Botrytis byssoidea TaxID=139641 RepID=A0A9P5HYQ6_9HELO|nr:uncharacterized protein EAE97_009958 [Botrytis byssoidea]KAF7927283.1 hypothetical protein EAE97_009958 [Botrytis byssoidea]